MHRVLIVLALLFVDGAASAQPTFQTAFAFILLGEGADGAPVPMVRTVVEGATSCPVLRDAAGTTVSALTPRQRPAGARSADLQVRS
jgi:hypothetical protein